MAEFINNPNPFIVFCQKTIPLAFDESMSFMEAMYAFKAYLENEVVPAVNSNAQAVVDLTNLVNQMQDYIDHYFDNLDVQEEINNKLDNMVQDGSLTTLIGAYVDPIQTAFETQINEELETKFNEQDLRIVDVENLVDSAVSGTPLTASSTSGMTDTDRIYVNTTDGHWYYYNGSAWVDGGVYQATAIGENAVDIENLNANISEQISQIVIDDEDIEEYVNGKYIGVGNGATQGTSGLNNLSSYSVYGPFEFYKGDIVSFTAKGEGSGDTVTILGLSSGKNSQNNDLFWSILQATSSDETTYTTKLNYSGKYYITSKNAVGVKNLKIYRLNKSFVNDKTEHIKDCINNIIIDQSNTTGFTRGQYINYSNGNAVNGTVNTTTGYIEIVGGTKIVLHSDIPSFNTGTQTPDLSGYGFYDKNKAFISGIQKPTGVQKKEMDVPDNAKYIRLTINDCMLINGFELYYINLQGTINYLLEKVKSADIGDNIDRTIGLCDNAVFIGDSLTVGQYYISNSSSYRNFYNYPYFLKKMMQINNITELASSGATSTSWWNAFADDITATNSIYFVWLGTNDNFTDTVSTDCAGDDYTQYANTETGNMGKILAKIKSLDGNKIILLNCFASSGHQEETNDILNQLATRFDVDLVIDIINTDVRNLKYHTAYNGHVNQVHFNDKGNNFIASVVKKQLNDYLAEHQFEMIKRYS